jgi:hypothetical protein
MTTGITTSPVPLTVGSDELFQLVAFKDGVPWDLTGGAVTLKLQDPTGAVTSVSGTVSASGATAPWTVTAPAGTWLRAWHVLDAAGVHQVSRPIAFIVTDTP